MRRIFLTLILAAAAFTAASEPIQFPGVSGDRVYLFSASRYMNIQKDQGFYVNKAMQLLKSRDSKRSDFHEIVRNAQAITDRDWNENYLKLGKPTPAVYTDIDSAVRRSHDLREAAYKEWLGKKNHNPATLKNANKLFEDSLAAEEQAMDGLLDALGLKKK